MARKESRLSLGKEMKWWTPPPPPPIATLISSSQLLILLEVEVEVDDVVVVIPITSPPIFLNSLFPSIKSSSREGSLPNGGNVSENWQPRNARRVKLYNDVIHLEDKLAPW
ncbi:hypothetical protein FNV43_RR07409 [Rhamnella rubrinervis]|uniref:Uncharacterized protein n=1 Tax=Rhamnella rubrinervis TaxID=2594499 RepID=A0A8K0HFQ0_9ROSA|nr:hypothetical protein FNV43_RR07409 [Rhamnella rubrinervis]